MEKRKDYQEMTLGQLLRKRDKRALMISGGKNFSASEIEAAATAAEMTEVLR